MAARDAMMRRAAGSRWLAWGLLLVLGGLAGCGDDSGPDEVVFSSRPAAGLTVRGTVYAATRAGSRGAPLAGVSVHLSGAAAVRKVSDGAGEYRFEDLAPGLYRVVAEAPGYQSVHSEDVVLLPGATEMVDGTTVTVELDLRSNPVLLGVEPQPESVVDPGALRPSLRFSEPVLPSSLTVGLYLLGARGAPAGVAREVACQVVFDETGEQVALEPSGTLPAGSSYELRLAGQPAVLDRDGFPLDLSGSGGGLTEQTFRFHTAMEGEPSMPQGLQLSLEGDPSPELDWPLLQAWPGGIRAVGLQAAWLADDSGPRSFELRAACGQGPTLVVERLGDVTSWRGRLGDLADLLFGVPGQSLEPLERGNVPAINCALRLELAVLGDAGPGPAASATLVDRIPPRLVWAGRTAPAGVELPEPPAPADEPDAGTPGPAGRSLFLGLSEPVQWTASPSQILLLEVAGQSVPVAELRSVYQSATEPLGEQRLFAVLELLHGDLPAEGDLSLTVRGGLFDLSGNELRLDQEGARLEGLER